MGLVGHEKLLNFPCNFALMIIFELVTMTLNGYFCRFVEWTILWKMKLNHAC